MPNPPLVAGVDGRRGGWVVVRVAMHATTLRLAGCEQVATIEEVLADAALSVIAVDMPIGLPTTGPREADVQARRLLRPHGARVFPTPVRAACDHPDDYAEACAASHRAQGKALSRQAWNIIGKIREVDEHADDPRLVEVHPELSFAWLNGGRPIADRKKSAVGRAARLAVLNEHIQDIDPLLLRDDDAIDAAAAAWTATRIASGTAVTLPERPPLDDRGRPMRIVV